MIEKVSKENALAQAQSFSDLGLEGWTPEDLVIPQLRIAQPTSQVDITPGRFYDTLSGESWDEITVVFLKSSWGRVLFHEELGEGVVCRSMDRVRPSDRIENPPAEFCHECPHSKWIDGNPPKCKEQLINFLLKVNEDFSEVQPYIFTVHGANLKPLKTLISLMVARRQPLYSKVIHMKTNMVVGEKGKYFVVKYTIQGDVPAEVLSQFREMSKQYTSSVAEEVLDEGNKDEEGEIEF